MTLEESVVAGGFGSAVLEALTDAALDDESLRVPVKIVGLPADQFVDHGAVGDLRRLPAPRRGRHHGPGRARR